MANLTVDVLQTAGPARDMILVGAGQSEVEDLGDSTRWPQWKTGSEFKAIREWSDAARQ